MKLSSRQQLYRQLAVLEGLSGIPSRLFADEAIPCPVCQQGCFRHLPACALGALVRGDLSRARLVPYVRAYVDALGVTGAGDGRHLTIEVLADGTLGIDIHP